jgi:hypothetical protein
MPHSEKSDALRWSPHHPAPVAPRPLPVSTSPRLDLHAQPSHPEDWRPQDARPHRPLRPRAPPGRPKP